jgi:hypothetical protein
VVVGSALLPSTYLVAISDGTMREGGQHSEQIGDDNVDFFDFYARRSARFSEPAGLPVWVRP